MLRLLQKPAALLMLGCFLSLPTFAQSTKKTPQRIITKDETVIIKNPDAGGRTVVEIKNGIVYVNGRSIMSVRDADATRVHKKIIIENGPGTQHAPDENWNDDARPDFPDMPGAAIAPPAELGVMTEDATGRQGVMVKEVLPGSAAAAAGLQKGDIITRVDGRIIANASALVTSIRKQHQPGDEVAIRYERMGQEYNTKARLGQSATREIAPNWQGERYPQNFFRNHPFEPWDPFRNDADAHSGPRLGVSVEDRADGQGVLVLQVKPGSAAALAGIQSQDIITRFADDDIHSVADLQSAISGLQPDAKATISFLRDGKEKNTTADFPKPLHRKDL
ncbi:MAG: PDZ domain-containing protein [Bacteroidetes bacterium]|nr:PDZ domain-containing protein [Bacteroidota bacterium]